MRQPLNKSSEPLKWPGSSQTFSDMAPYLLAGLELSNQNHSLLRSLQSNKKTVFPPLHSVAGMRIEKDAKPFLPVAPPSDLRFHPLSKQAALPQRSLKKNKIFDASIRKNAVMDSIRFMEWTPHAISQIALDDATDLKSLKNRSFYNRKCETNIYSKPPSLRRARPHIYPNDPEFGCDQKWIESSWEPISKFIQTQHQRIFLKSDAHRPLDPLPMETPVIESTLVNQQIPQVIDSLIPYELPKRQEYKKLDESLVARLVEIQTGHLAHKHRRMRPTLGISTLSRVKQKHRSVNIGPSIQKQHHLMMDGTNEEPDDLDLSLQLSTLSLKEREFHDTLHQISKRSYQAQKRAACRRQEKSSRLFRSMQEQVEMTTSRRDFGKKSVDCVL